VLWRNDDRQHYSVVVAGDVVYAGNTLAVSAYNAAGCGAATCQPIWQHDFGRGFFPTPPAVTGGRLYVNSLAAGVAVFAVPS
jgi:outer membrane protein assembly factor BamB